MDEKKPKAPNRVQTLEITVNTDAHSVWEAVSTSDGISRWFSPEAKVKPGEGGEVFFSWGGEMAWTSRITKWQPGALMEITDQFPAAEEGAPAPRLVVQFQIEAAAGTTTLRVVQSGFDNPNGWDDLFDGTEGGWRYFLVNLKHYLERQAGQARRVALVRGKIPGERGEAWKKLFGEGGFAASLPIGEVRPGGALSLNLGLGAMPAEAELHLPGTHLGARLPSLGDGHLMVELEQGEPVRSLGVQVSLYGDATARADEVQVALEAWSKGVFLEPEAVE